MQHNLISLFSRNKAVSKILSCCAVFVFVFVLSAPVSAHALADPVMQPVYDTQFYQLPQTFNGLSGPQQDIFYFVLGNNLISYAGLSDYEIENPYSDPDNLGDWIKKLGYDLYNDVIESFSIAGAPIISAYKYSKELFGNIIGAMNFAGAFNNSSWQDFYTDVQTNGLDLQLYPTMFSALNQYFAEFGGLYQWQFSYSDFVTDLQYPTVSMSDTQQAAYYELVSGYNLPNPRCIQSSYYNVRYLNKDDFFNTYNLIFVNTSTNYIYLVNSSGDAPSSFSTRLVHCNSSGVPSRTSSMSFPEFTSARHFNPSDYSSIPDLVQSFYNNVFNDNTKVFYSDFILSVYAGSDWSSRQLVTNSSDLNFGESDSNNYLSPSDQVLLDIKGLLQDLLEQNDLRAPVLDNMSNPDGTPVTVQQLQPVSVAVELPDSGVTVPPNLFTPLFGDPGQHNGYIWYLWSMTKPLVLYTKDFLNTLLFDGNGIAWIVYGVISVGLVGGLIVKFLL